MMDQHRSSEDGSRPEVTGFFDPSTNTISYVAKDPNSTACAIVDSVLDMDYAAGRISHDSADRIISFVKSANLTVEWLIETHVHADHLSAAPYIQRQLGGMIGIGRLITTVQETFGKIFGEGQNFRGMDRNSTGCLMTTTVTWSAPCRAVPSALLATRPPA